MFPPTLWIGIGLHKGGDSVARLASADLSTYAVLNPALDLSGARIRRHGSGASPVVRAAGLVPASDHRQVVLVREGAQSARVERQQRSVLGPEPEPAGGEHAQHVTVAERDRVAVGGADLRHDPIGAQADVGGGLAIRAAVTPQAPARPPRLDLERRDALVVAVVPLTEVVADLRPLGEAGELAGLDRAAKRAREDEREGASSKARGEGRGAPPAFSGQWEVRATGVSPACAPLGFAMTGEHHL